MKRVKNIAIQGKHDKPIVTDVFFEPTKKPKPIVIFCHGFKGFKDWGAWDLVAEEIAKAGFFFIKFNFSHNGGTLEEPIDFPDLEAFGNDNYSIQLDDLEVIINWISNQNDFLEEIDPNNINLIGHSRGGGMVLIGALENPQVKKVITWAGVSDYLSRFPKGDKLEEWRKKGVFFVENKRTKQQMPQYFQLFEDFEKNESRFNILQTVKSLEKPYLIIHGTVDETVPLSEAKLLHQWKPNSKLFLVEDGNHVFGAKHPWESNSLPDALKTTLKKSLEFLKE